MNEFTKEELIEIMSLIRDRRNSLADFLPLHPLVLKINRLIETYDEPETIRDIMARTKRHGGCSE